MGKAYAATPRQMAGKEHLSLIKLMTVKSSVTALNILQIYKVYGQRSHLK